MRENTLWMLRWQCQIRYPIQKYQHLTNRRYGCDGPFFPYPLKSEVAHVNRKPFCKSTEHFRIKAIRAICVKFANRLSDRGSDCWRRQLTQFCDQSSVVNGFGGTLWKQELCAKYCLGDPSTSERNQAL